MKEITLRNAQDFPIAVKIFEPEISNGKLLLINSATGVKQQVYFAFAKYLCNQGFTVITYDYSGIGESKPKKLKGFASSMRIWGTEDYGAVINYIKSNYLHYQKFALGHSVGALILGMNADSKIFDRFVFVATQDAFLGNLSLKVGVAALFGFGIAVPVFTSILGYFPAHYFGLGESLPRGVAYDWRTLILHKNSIRQLFNNIPKDYSKELIQKTFIIYAEDDEWVTMKGMENLMNKAYPNLQKSYRKITVAESEKGEVGHINYFRSYNKKLWKIVLDELQ